MRKEKIKDKIWLQTQFQPKAITLYLIDDIAIDFQFFGNFANNKNIRRKCNSTVDLLKSHPIKRH